MRPPARRRRGFTLLEMLIATGILAMVLAIGVPNLVTMRGPYALKSASQQVAADLQLARQRAIAQNTRYRVTFSAGSYVLERETSSNSWVQDSGVQKVPPGATIGGASPGNPVFDSRGMLAGDVTVPITVDGIGTRTVTINVLGRTTIS